MPKDLVIQAKLEVYQSLSELPEELTYLVEQATEAARKAYAPYSKLHVGAALILENGQTVQGNNQENAAYPSGLCAERVTMFSASSKFPDMKIVAIAVLSIKKGIIASGFPCGSCRQVMIEYEKRQKTPIRVVMSDSNGNFLISKAVKDLLPLAFTSEDL